MKISQYIKKYTAGKPITLWNVIVEAGELMAEIIKANKEGIKEEFEDVFLFIQCWLYWQFNIDGQMWKISQNSAKKFADRKPIWNRIYREAGLAENVSGYVGNYQKMEKVVRHLAELGIGREKSEEAYSKVILGK